MFLVFAVNADEIYKSVDKQGNILYSAEPPDSGAEAQILQVPPGPGQEEIDAANQRREDLNRAVEETKDEADQAEAEQRQAAGGQEDAPDTARVVGGGWEARADDERRRAIWGKDWPIHHPRNRR